MTAADPLRAALIEAARAFNIGHYFEAHEAIEDALDDAPAELWELCIGLIQISVGYHKVTQGLHRGAIGMLDRGLQKLAPFPADAAGLNVALLRERARSDLEALRSGGFDADAFHRQPPRLRPLA